ncbi:hypothetical protein ACIQKE_37930 [Streptomyces griseoviridis]|uniref:hypothetical protein n=1 Tax=Streptomyces sp. NPDC094437 TaxID=3366060 RepID=UPI003803B3DA
MFRRSADYGRSARIMNSALDYSETEGADGEFVGLVVNSMLEQARREDADQYPPEGHDYPHAN